MCSVDNISGDCNSVTLDTVLLVNFVTYLIVFVMMPSLIDIRQKVEVGCSKQLQSRKFVYDDCVTAVKNLSTAKSDVNAGVYPMI